eukprot:2982544-Prorocentrum_lima.AAC.1
MASWMRFPLSLANGRQDPLLPAGRKPIPSPAHWRRIMLAPLQKATSPEGCKSSRDSSPRRLCI